MITCISIVRNHERALSKGINVRTRSVRRARSGEFLVDARSDIDAQIVRCTRFLEAKDKSNHLLANFFSIKAGVEQFSSGKTND